MHNYIWSSKANARYIPKRVESMISNKYLHTHVHNSMVHNSQDMEITQMSINGYTDKTQYIHKRNIVQS